MLLRLSIGSAIVLGLRSGFMECLPSTVYVMLGGGCRGVCGFCAQARDAGGGDRLSRVVWSEVGLGELVDALDGSPVRRVCIQTLDYVGMVDDLVEVVSVLSPLASVSAAVNPLSRVDLERVRDAGLERVGIGLDAASRSVYEDVKGVSVGGRFGWEDAFSSIFCARDVFGSATAHVIVGLGESDRDVVRVMGCLMDGGVRTSLFAATPVRGSRMDFSPPPLGRYRVLQVARGLVTLCGSREADFAFERDRIVRLPDGWRDLGGEVFMTRGCPDCNRPYYNEPPGVEPYNYPCTPGVEQVEKAYKDMLEYIGV